MRLFIIISILLLCSVAYAVEPPVIEKFDITYSEFRLLPFYLQATFLDCYFKSKKVDLDDVKMTDIDNIIESYALNYGNETLMPEILNAVIERLGKPKM